MITSLEQLSGLKLFSLEKSKIVGIIYTKSPNNTRDTNLLCFENGQVLSIQAVDGTHFLVHKYGDFEFSEIDVAEALKRDFNVYMFNWYKATMDQARQT